MSFQGGTTNQSVLIKRLLRLARNDELKLIKTQNVLQLVFQTLPTAFWHH